LRRKRSAASTTTAIIRTGTGIPASPDYHFTVKNNQPGLFQDIALYFEDRRDPDFVQRDPPDHGRIEIRKIWTTTELNGYLKSD
jgi:hypothetical protein